MIDLIVVGAGPSGLSCAIAAKQNGLTAVVLEKGSLVDAIRRFPSNLVWFSTPELLEIGGVPFVLSTVRPTRIETLTYYQKVVQHYGLDVRYFDAVESVVRGDDAFRISTERHTLYDGRNVVVATGYFDHPNHIQVPGESLPNVMHYYDEAYRYFGCNVAVVGGRNSAVEAALDLFRHGAHVTLIHRGEQFSPGVKYWILPDIQNRIKAGEIRACFSSTVHEIRATSIVVNGGDGMQEFPNEFTFVLVGFHPDTALLERFGVQINAETLGPCYDEKTFETNVPGLYVAGSIVAGKFNNKVFVENGRLHGAIIVSSILSHRSTS
jgi:thioredoxin reductase (NADPH)